MKDLFKVSSSGQQYPAALFAAFALVALVPVACVLWFMTAAMRNERLAVQERLKAVHVSQLEVARQQVAAAWTKRTTELEATSGATPAATFAAIVSAGLAESVVLYDRAGKPSYPNPAIESSISEPADWAAARALEFQKLDYAAAATAYGSLAAQSDSPHAKSRALQSEAASLLKLGQKPEALAVLERLVTDPALHDAVSAQGTLIVPNAELLILKIAPEEKTRSTLVRRLNDYNDSALSAGQRLFLMVELQALAPKIHFPTLAAEKIAADYLEHETVPAAAAGLQHSALAGVWQLTTADRSRIALWGDDSLRNEITRVANAAGIGDLQVKVLAPGENNGPSPIAPQDISDLLPGWRLALHFNGSDPFAAASARETSFYLWAGLLVIVIIALLAWLVARYVAAQVRLARLKNDLVSTVSHELKTPLASMRALVDTLITDRCRDETQRREYLLLIAKENVRLSEVIDNFLTFSRLERGKQHFQFEPLAPGQVMAAAVAALKEKLGSAHCRFEQRVDPDLPAIRGDANAMSTVLINLLDNAYKYTDSEKRIQARAFVGERHVCFEVADNGIGFEPSEATRIFDRFYQIDQSLTRRRGGCGLGLGIVDYIVRAHHGVIQVQSEPGKGSTFRVRIPLANATP